MPESFEQKLIKIKPEDVVDELYGAPKTEGQRKLDDFRKKDIPKLESVSAMEDVEQLMVDLFGEQYGKQEAIIINPSEPDYKKLSERKEPTDFGMYTLNPETQNLNFERLKIFMPDFSHLTAMPIHTIMDDIMIRYRDTHHIPGIEYWKWLYENPSKIPAILKKDNHHYFPGSVLCENKSGSWAILGAHWEETNLRHEIYELTNKWHGRYDRIVLLEK